MCIYVHFRVLFFLFSIFQIFHNKYVYIHLYSHISIYAVRRLLIIILIKLIKKTVIKVKVLCSFLCKLLVETVLF
jgi:hypothetical protein